MATNLTKTGIEVIKEAKALDEKAQEVKDPQEQLTQLRAAIKKYSVGIQYLMEGKKFEKNKQIQDTIGGKITEYMERAEKLTKICADLEANKGAPPKKKAQAEGGDGDGDADGDAEDEDAAMKSKLGGSILMEKPNVKWDDVAGLMVAKQLLQEAVILPVKFPQFFVGKRKAWKGILLYGPPGTGKSYLAKAVATEANNSTFFSVSSSSLVSKYVGESEKQVKQLFKLAAEKRPSIVFIDEIDSMATARSDGENESSRRLKTEFLVNMDGVGSDTEGVLVLGATNCPWDLDPAIRRRFQKRIYIPLPDAEARRAMFAIHVGKTPCNLLDKDFDYLAQETEGFSGSDIANVVKDALMQPVRDLQSSEFFVKVGTPEGYRILPCRPPVQAPPPGQVTPEFWQNFENWPVAQPSGPGWSDNAKFEIKLMNIPEPQSGLVQALELKREDFLRVIGGCRSSVSDDDLRRHEVWTQEFGQEG